MNVFGKLPIDIVINHIIPYSYQVQSPRLLMDIQSFYNDFTIVENYYSYDYNDNVLLFDLLQFLKGSQSMRFERTLQQHYYYKDKESFHLHYVAMMNYDENKFIDSTRKCRFLFGLMNPIQRTRFINKYIIKDEY